MGSHLVRVFGARNNRLEGTFVDLSARTFRNGYGLVQASSPNRNEQFAMQTRDLAREQPLRAPTSGIDLPLIGRPAYKRRARAPPMRNQVVVKMSHVRIGTQW
jgi:hypothetical protein